MDKRGRRSHNASVKADKGAGMGEGDAKARLALIFGLGCGSYLAFAANQPMLGFAVFVAFAIRAWTIKARAERDGTRPSPPALSEEEIERLNKFVLAAVEAAPPAASNFASFEELGRECGFELAEQEGKFNSMAVFRFLKKGGVYYEYEGVYSFRGESNEINFGGLAYRKMEPPEAVERGVPDKFEKLEKDR